MSVIYRRHPDGGWSDVTPGVRRVMIVPRTRREFKRLVKESLEHQRQHPINDSLDMTQRDENGDYVFPDGTDITDIFATLQKQQLIDAAVRDADEVLQL